LEVKSIPLNRNGKVDGKELEKLFLNSQINKKQLKNNPEFSGLHKQLYEIWVEILGGIDVNKDTNFFEAVGHSRQATQIINVVNEKLKINLTLKDIFRTPIFSQFANLALKNNP